MQFDNTLTINAPVGEVFAYLARPENLPRWNYALDRTEQTSPGPFAHPVAKNLNVLKNILETR